MMSSYNVINGRRASESRELLTDILRSDWGYTGMVMTDWWTRGEHYKDILAGNDLKMANVIHEISSKLVIHTIKAYHRSRTNIGMYTFQNA